MQTGVRNWLKTKRGRRGLWAAAALAVYALVGFVGLPWILGKVLPAKAGEWLGREVTIERIRINPFVLSGSFQGLLVKDPDGTPLLSWDEVYGNFQLSSLVRRAFTFKEVRVEKPQVNLYIKPDHTLNISDILERLRNTSGTPSPDEEPTPPALRVDRITITNAVARVSDYTLREPFTRQIGPVNLLLEDLHTHPDSQNLYSIAGSTGAGERFRWSGHFFLYPLRSDGEVSVEHVNIAGYSPFYQDFVSLTIHDGIIDLSVEYSVEFGGSNNVLTVSNSTFHLASLKVSSNDDKTRNALEVGDLKVSGIEADLRARRARIGQVTGSRGSLFVHRTADAAINLIAMTEPSTTNAEPAGAVLYAMRAVTNLISTFLATTNQAAAVIDSLEFSNCQLDLQDDVNSRPVRLRLDEISLTGSNLSNVPGEDLSMGFACRWNTNGSVNVDVAAKLFPIHSDVRINIDRIDLPPLDPYAEPFANVLLLDSRFSMDGVVHIRREEMAVPFDLDFEGRLRLEDFSSIDGVMGTGLLEWRALNVDGIRASLHPFEVHVREVAIRDAHARLVVETNRSINVLNALHVGDTHARDRAPDSSSPPARPTDPELAGNAGIRHDDLDLPAITLSSIVISNAALEILDASTQPPLSWSLTDVNGEIGGVSSTSTQRADLRMTARAGGSAPVAVTGAVNPLNPEVNTDVAIELTGMDLLPFSPYAGRYAGYGLRKGALSLDLRYRIRGRALDSENVIVLDQFSLGQRVESPEATKLPVKLGVAVLKDRNGVITLDVPVEGDLDDPEFRLGRVIGRTLMITLTKMLSSPFSLLGGMVGGTAEELSQVAFAPGSSAIRPGETNGLQKLSRALYERPALEVEIQGSVSRESDGLAIRKQKLHRRLQQLRWAELRESAQATSRPEDIVLSPDLRTTLLRRLFVEVFPGEARSSRPPPGLEETFYERITDRLLDQMEVGEDDFRALAVSRAESVRDYLARQGGVAPERLFLVQHDGPVAGEGSRVLLQLQ